MPSQYSNLSSTQLAEGLSKICRQAGKAILEVYNRSDFGVQTKSDNSPLTEADLAAHHIIVDGLADLVSDVPTLSEESDKISFKTRSRWNRYFLVDPLDGTKEFINRNGEFTVNIALIENHVPIMGAVYVPVKDVLYIGINVGEDRQAYKIDKGRKTLLATRSMTSSAVTVVASRRHGSEEMERCMALLNENFDVDTKNVGSSLKFCQIAEGGADLYPRLAPTSEWDTGAAQAVVTAAGGLVVDDSFAELQYNTKENILNPFFFVIADTDYPWQKLLSNIS
ncbi:MAG: 3'(2'),5'-bisphosphate nucleotidase CysQ [Pseudomonadales bacterium]|nr:3'(2'),5'-bisphosphate nucleotidase CysQ [Pseudomonadales bacterium]MDG1442657.1 3'(2'),5'-bisphosphate nucleotidase CysQ [Pseudomonadales bacterium]